MMIPGTLVSIIKFCLTFNNRQLIINETFAILISKGDHVPEHVGPPVACCCIKLVDVPEMEYYAINNQGEVCVKGTNVFVGYFKDPEKTAEVVDELGWHHTGDVGMWLPVRIQVSSNPNREIQYYYMPIFISDYYLRFFLSFLF